MSDECVCRTSLATPGLLIKRQTIFKNIPVKPVKTKVRQKPVGLMCVRFACNGVDWVHLKYIESLLNHSLQHTENCTLNTEHWTLQTKYCLHYSLNSVHCTLHTRNCTMLSSHCILHTQFTLNIDHCRMYNDNYELHTAHCKLHIKHRQLHTTR